MRTRPFSPGFCGGFLTFLTEKAHFQPRTCARPPGGGGARAYARMSFLSFS